MVSVQKVGVKKVGVKKVGVKKVGVKGKVGVRNHFPPTVRFVPVRPPAGFAPLDPVDRPARPAAGRDPTGLTHPTAGRPARSGRRTEPPPTTDRIGSVVGDVPLKNKGRRR